MTEPEQRIAIAEFCGLGERLEQEKQWSKGTVPFISVVPDYLHDLNAMHEAEKTLDHAHRILFINFLAILIVKEQKPKISDMTKCIHEHACHATAAQRAEALLRTIGKWKE